MRRSASEIIRNLEQRVARLEKQSRPEMALLGVVIDKIERQYGIKINKHITNGGRDAMKERVIVPNRDYIRGQLKINKRIWVESVKGKYGWWLNWN